MRPARLLLVDDDPNLLKVLTIRLAAANFEVQVAEGAEQALALLPVFHPEVLITDLRMGGMDGLALLKQAQARYPTLPVIVLTGHATIDQAVEATQNGAFGFLTKPFKTEDLLELAARAVQIAGGATSTNSPQGDPSWRAEIITCSPEMHALLDQVPRVAKSLSSVLIQSESGTGKELLARAIHRCSERADAPFVAVNCSAIPESLFEAELFGYEKGAFTGANRAHQGLVQAASTGTLFLDEVGDMPLNFQAKLLRAIQEKEVRPVGAIETVPVEFRIIAATHRDLKEEIAEGRFREDLFYRLNVINLRLPPLRERREDIALLATHFLSSLQGYPPHTVKAFAPEALEMLVSASWPGNVRQLQNVMEQILTLASSPLISAASVRAALGDSPPEVLPFGEARDQFERGYLMTILRVAKGNVSHAARLARRERSRFYKLLRRHAINPRHYRPAGSAAPD
jgi:two-component system response regulator GlrR